MSRFPLLGSFVLLMFGSSLAMADARSHAAETEKFLYLVHADKLTVPVYAQVQQMFAQRFVETKADQSKQALLESYQAKANAELDKAVGWNKLKPEMVKLYVSNFTEQEMQELIAFYQSPLGQKVLQKMPVLTAQSAQITQSKIEAAAPAVNKLLSDMTRQLDAK